MDIGHIVFEHEINHARIMSAIFESDDIGSVIRCHFEIERALDYTLNKLSSDRFGSRDFRWDFTQKIEIARILGIPDKWLNPVRTINKHRNHLAHRGKDALTIQDTLDLQRQLLQISPKFDDALNVFITGTHSIEKKLGECTNREKYVVLTCGLIMMISSIINISRNQN